MMFYMRLALRLGRSVRELLASVSSAELSLWEAYDRLEPLGDARADLRAGIVAATVANYSSRQIKEALQPADFMPLLRERKPAHVSLSQKIRQGLLAASSSARKGKR